MVAVGAAGLFALLVPVGCVATAAIGTGALAVTTADCFGRTSSSPSPSPVEAGTQPDALGDQVASWCDDDLEGPGTSSWLVADASAVVAPNPAAAQAVASALAAVGRGGRYVAEGNGPVDFDCSGLTAFAWRQAGVRLEDYSFSQWSRTTRIPRSAAQPGDLVFWFGGEVHHVAIITAVQGDTITIAEAANPDDGLRVRTLGSSWDNAYLSGFGRVNT